MADSNKGSKRLVLNSECFKGHFDRELIIVTVKRKTRKEARQQMLRTNVAINLNVLPHPLNKLCLEQSM